MPEKGKANLSVACAWVAENTGCLSVTQEQPFKDNCLLPNEKTGWSVERCRKLGSAAVDAIWGVWEDL